MDAPALLSWDFANTSPFDAAVAVGLPCDPQVVSGYVGQSGGGPAEELPEIGQVFLTRQLGEHELLVWLTVTRRVRLTGVTFTHWHTHTKGAATDPSYRIQLEYISDEEDDELGRPLTVSKKNSGATDTIAFDRVLAPGSHAIYFTPRNLKADAPHTGKDYFALGSLTLHGEVLAAKAAKSPAASPPAGSPARPSGAIGDTVDVELAGVTVERLKVMEAKYKGKCALTGAAFEPGEVIGFKHRDSLTPEQAEAIFGGKKAGHLMVLVTPPSAEPAAAPDPSGSPVGGPPVACTPDPTRLAVFREAKARKSKREEWLEGNLSCQAVGYSCGCLAREGMPPKHLHDPAELARCARLAGETADRLRDIRLGGEGDPGPFRPYFAAAPLGTPPPKALDVAVVQTAFGGTISPEVDVVVEPMREGGSWWASEVDTHWIPAERAKVAKLWRAFMKWFAGVPGLRAHSFVLVGTSDDAPGAVLPRLVVALTDAGSLVGVASFVVQT